VKLKHHISYLYNTLLEYYPLHQAQWQTRWHNPPDWGLLSSVATCLALWSVIQQRVYKTRVHDIDDLRQRLLHVAWLGAVADWWRSWPMANALACLCYVSGGHFEHTFNLLSVYMMNFMFHTMIQCVIFKEYIIKYINLNSHNTV